MLFLQVVQQTAPKALTVQTLQTMGVAAGGGAALTPIFTAIGQTVKQASFLRNEWLRWILPFLAVFLACSILYLEVRVGYTVEPLTAFLFIGMFLAAALGADATYNALKNTSILPAGPNNHPADAATAASNTTTVSIPNPTTTAVTTALKEAGATTTEPTTVQPLPQVVQPPIQQSTSSSELPPSPFKPL